MFRQTPFFFDYYDDITTYKLKEIALQLLKTRPERLVFPDHSPSPFKLLRILYELAPNYSPEITIHIYGNFVRYFSQWLNDSEGIKNRKILFIAASHAYARFIAPCFQHPKQIAICPFPVNIENYQFNEKLRLKKRKELGWNDHDFGFILTGRKSMQKNFLKTIELFSFCVQKNPQIRLLALGDFDESAPPLFNEFYCRKEGQFFQIWQNLYYQLPESIRKKITILPHLNDTDLSNYLSASDCFMSLSFHHYEDFGLSPVEALSNGLPSILTGWGGHLDHIQHLPKLAHKIQVSCDLQGLKFDDQEVLERMENLISNPCMSLEKRRHAQQECAEYYSLYKITQNLVDLHNSFFPLFNGFNKGFEEKNLLTIANTKDLNYHPYIKGFYES